MGNIKNYNFDRLDFKLSNSEYYDFYLNNDAIKDKPHYDTNLTVEFDFSIFVDELGDFLEVDFNVDDFLVHHFLPAGVDSESGWTGTITSDFSATTFGLTGLDNGVIPYDESTDDDAHTGLLNLLTDTALEYTSGNDTLHLNIVSGGTGQYIYPIEVITDSGATGNYLKFCGGFFQHSLKDLYV